MVTSIPILTPDATAIGGLTADELDKWVECHQLSHRANMANDSAASAQYKNKGCYEFLLLAPMPNGTIIIDPDSEPCCSSVFLVTYPNGTEVEVPYGYGMP